MSTTSSEAAGGLQTLPPRSSPQLADAFHLAHFNDEKLSFGPFQLLPARRLLLERGKPVRIGSRALDILSALVEHPGELISKSELMTKVWPNTFVEEGNLKVHIAALRRALADGQAGNRYISVVPGRGYCFVAPVDRSADPRPAMAQHLATELSTNVPEPLMRLIGIDDAISGVSALLERHRLITLVGPGGIGKTSVAIATASSLIANYEHGVWFVDLAAISEPRLLAAAVGSATRPDLAGEDPSAGLFSYLSDRRMLLVLDNCEHIVEAAAAWVFQAMQTAPYVKILATSREPLGVVGERVNHLQSLQMPPVSATLSASEALEFPAIQLFVDRAASSLGEFILRDVDVPIVIDICQKVDGIPLAIELAAAGVDALGLRGVASRLDLPLRLPANGRRTAALRHRTLRAALDWSYRLLTEEEQRVLRRLSVFVGNFSMKAAAAVAADPAYTEGETENHVIALVAKSLVAADGIGSDARLRLLMTTRAYALERLAESGEGDAISRRQAQVIPTLAEADA
jgi:predicted ATPase/DNA-binding winged helix-turn-helix (wHTH) protein